METPNIEDLKDLEEYQNNILREILNLPKCKIQWKYFTPEEVKQILDFN